MMALTLRIIGVLLVSVVAGMVAFYRKQKKPQRIMQEGRLLKSETVSTGGEQFYVEKVAFKDWPYVSIPSI